MYIEKATLLFKCFKDSACRFRKLTCQLIPNSSRILRIRHVGPMRARRTLIITGRGKIRLIRFRDATAIVPITSYSIIPTTRRTRVIARTHVRRYCSSHSTPVEYPCNGRKGFANLTRRQHPRQMARWYGIANDPVKWVQMICCFQFAVLSNASVMKTWPS